LAGDRGKQEASDSRPRHIPEAAVVTLKSRRLSFWKQDALNVQDGLTQPAGVYLALSIAPHDVYGPLAALPLDCRLINLESLLEGHAPVQIVAGDPLAAPLPFAFDALCTNPKPHTALDAVRSGEADRVGLVFLSEYLRSYRGPDFEEVGVFAAY
jgi:hypothetical protein